MVGQVVGDRVYKRYWNDANGLMVTFTDTARAGTPIVEALETVDADYRDGSGIKRRANFTLVVLEENGEQVGPLYLASKYIDINQPSQPQSLKSSVGIGAGIFAFIFLGYLFSRNK